MYLHVFDHHLNWDLFVEPLSYPYDSQEHRTTVTTSFGLMVSCQPPILTTVVTLTGLSTHDNLEAPPKAVRLLQLSRIPGMRYIAYKRSKATHQWYKLHHDAQMREEHRSSVYQLVYMDFPPLSTSTAYKRAVETFSELPQPELGPYHVTSTTLHTITGHQDGIPNTISADQSLLAFTICNHKGAWSTANTTSHY